METSTLITVIYFFVNIVLLLILSFYIMKTGEHSDLKSFGKDTWAQRKIYAPIIIHFYDSATDIGVVYYWHGLMMDEQNGVYDYESVDMEIFFWCGVAFLLLYRVMLFGSLIWAVVVENASDVNWYDPILVLLEVYVFRTVYLSYRNAQGVIEENVKARKQRKQSAAPSESEAGATPTVTTDTETPEKEIDVHEIQKFVLLGESITESLPQIMLQSVFIIRSYNDENLRGDSIWLLLVSVFASLLSITDKFVKVEEDEYAQDRGRSPKCKDISNGLCCNVQTLGYALRVLFRMCHIGSNFTVYVLVWTVMGGAWLPIWCSALTIVYVLIMVIKEGCGDSLGIFMMAIISMGGIPASETTQLYAKWGMTMLGLVLVAVFAVISFECGICAESAQRRFDNEDETGVRNNRGSIFYAVGCAAQFMEIPLFFIMAKQGILKRRY